MGSNARTQTETTVSAASFSAIFSCAIVDLGQQLVCVDDVNEGKQQK